MEKKKKKTPTDINQLAKFIVDQTTCEPISGDAILKEPITEVRTEKNPAAVALGRLGGLKGGKARAEKLSAKKRKEIAQKAAKSRWSKTKPIP
jgi:hypothetical protein